MALDGIRNNVSQNHHLNPDQTIREKVPEFDYKSTIRHGEKESNRIMEMFGKIWEGFKIPFVKTWEFIEAPILSAWNWIKWVFSGCPNEKSSKEMYAEITSAPKKKAKEFASTPQEKIPELVVAALVDPTESDKMRNENNWNDFHKTFSKTYPDYSKLFENNNLIMAMKAILNPFNKNRNENFDSLKKWMSENPSLFARSFKRLAEKILKVVEKIPEEGGEDTVVPLRQLASEYMPNAAEFAEKNPDKYKLFLDRLYLQTPETLTPEAIIRICEETLFPPNAQIKAAIQKVFGDSNRLVVFERLAIPRLLNLHQTIPSEVKGTGEFPLAFYQCVLEVVQPEEIEKLIGVIPKDYPIIINILQRVKDQGKIGLEQIAVYLPESIKVLSKMHNDFFQHVKKKIE